MLHAIITSDWHIGAVDPNHFLEEIESTLLKILDKMFRNNGRLDAVFIVGDLFDSKQYFASEAVGVAFNILHQIDEYMRIFGGKLYLVTGTRTHDAGQLKYVKDIFQKLKNQTSRLELIETAQSIQLGDTEILILPEEYVADQKEYYKELFSHHYDIILGHGMIDKIWYAKKNKEDYGANQIMAAPVFELSQLLEIGEYTFFGHVHNHKYYNERRFRYLGPVTRWEFGAGTEVGLTYIEYDEKERKLVKDEFIENELAPYLPTRIINLMNDDTYELSDLNNLIDNLLAEELSNGASRIRFIVNLNSKLENASAIKDFLVTKIGDIPIAKLVLSTDFDKEVVNQMKDSMEQEKKTLDYVFNRNLDIEEKIKQFIQKKQGKELTIEKIKSYLEEES